MIKKRFQKLLSRFVEARIITEIVEIDPQVKLHEQQVQEFTEHISKKYGMTLEDLKSDFNPGKILGGPEVIFWEAYMSNPHSVPYEAREKMKAYKHVTNEVMQQWRDEAFLKMDRLKKIFSRNLAKVYKELAKEID